MSLSKLIKKIAVLAGIAGSTFSGASAEEANKTALTSIGGTATLDAGLDQNDPGIGGGFDQEAFFQNRYIPDLSICTEQIERVFLSWTDANNLLLPRREASEDQVLIHATSDTLDGIFELSYKIDAERMRARVTVFYLLKNGTALNPVLIKPLLDTWEIVDLQDELDDALKCDNVEVKE